VATNQELKSVELGSRIGQMEITAFTVVRLCAVVLICAGVHLSDHDAFSYDGECSEIADIENLPRGTWCEVPGFRLEDSREKPQEWFDWQESGSASCDSYQRVMGVKGITAWSSAAFDSRRQQLLVVGGGGTTIMAAMRFMRSRGRR
jgi:hypothetical protein